MSRLEDSVETQIRRAIERGDFDDLPGAGAPIDVSDQGPGWWARRKLDEIRSHDALIELARSIDDARDGIWRLPNLHSVSLAVEALNRRIRQVNEALDGEERLEQISPQEARRTWSRMHRLRSE